MCVRVCVHVCVHVCTSVCVHTRGGGGEGAGLACIHAGWGRPRGRERRVVEATEVALGSWGRPADSEALVPPGPLGSSRPSLGGLSWSQVTAPVLQPGHRLPGETRPGYLGGPRKRQASLTRLPWEAHARGSRPLQGPACSVHAAFCFILKRNQCVPCLSLWRITRIK